VPGALSGRGQEPPVLSGGKVRRALSGPALRPGPGRQGAGAAVAPRARPGARAGGGP